MYRLELERKCSEENKLDIYFFFFFFLCIHLLVVTMNFITQFLFIVVDKENVKPPVMEGLDALKEVSSALDHIISIDYFPYCLLIFFFSFRKTRV